MIENLNIEGVLKAERIVCRVSSTYSEQYPEGLILTEGSKFENLQIAGKKVDVKLRHRFLKDYERFDRLRDEIEKEKKAGKTARADDGVAVFTLVEGIETELPYVPKNGGYIFEVPNFGQVTLAEIFAEPAARTLTMLHLELGSPQTGNLTGGEGGTNGKPPPP